MYIHELEYHSPQSLKELLELLKTHGDDAKLLAGGTDLILQMKFNKWKQKNIIDVKEVQGLNHKAYQNGYFIIGCNTTLSEVLEIPEVKNDYRALWDAIHELADLQIRNRGTVVGNICNASPAADASPPLLVYGTKVVIVSSTGERELPLGEFFVGPGRTALKPDEMVKEVHIPKPLPNTYCSFQKLGRVYDDIAVINAAVQIQFDESLQIICAGIGMGAVGPTTRRAPIAESMLAGKSLDEHMIKAVAAQASDESSPIKDVRASAEYRKKMVGVLVERALTDVLNKAKNKKN
jgi:CO/xanthine dehydrogenase FAD-binding subunit